MDNEEMKRSLRELCRIESVAGIDVSDDAPYGAGCAQALDYALELCRRLGFETKLCENHRYGWAQIGTGETVVGILAHLDVVPAGSGWSHPAYDLSEENGRLYGRGVSDDKGPIIACIYAMKDILDAGLPLKRRVRIIFGQSEESGDWDDMAYYREHEELPVFGFTPDADFPAIYGEKRLLNYKLTMPLEESGLLDIRGGSASNVVPDHCEARLLIDGHESCISASGKASHASTPEDGENYNVVTGTVVVNAQTTTTTTTTTTNETTSTTKATTATSGTTSATKATTVTSGTTATTKATATTNETTATTEETTTNETTATTEETTTTSETTATTEETTTTDETTATTEETTTTSETTATTEATTTTNETTTTTKATTTTNETSATTEEITTTNETTATTKATTATSGTTSATKATTATSGTTSATKATTATSRTTSATKATTTKESTAASETTMTTSASSTESTAATSATTITTAATTSVTNIADEDLCSWAINDYQKKTGVTPANAEITARSEEACEITLTDENGNVLDVYTVDPKTGTGTDSSNAEVNLPQTGNNSMTNWLLCVGAAMFMAFGFGAVKASGIFKRKEDE